MKKELFNKIGIKSEESKHLFLKHFPEVKEDDITQEITIWSDNDYSITTFSSFNDEKVKGEFLFRKEIYYHNKERYYKDIYDIEKNEVIKREEILFK